MTSRIATISALAVPALFLAYAVVADFGFVRQFNGDKDLPKSVADYFNGAAATQIDTYYKSILPHRSPSIDLMGAFRYLVFGEGRSGVVVGKDGWLFTSEEYRATGDQTQDLADAKAGILKVRDALQKAGVALVVVPLPAKADIYREHAPDAIAPEQLETLYQDFRAELGAEGIKTVDTRPAILAAKASGPVFLEKDTHWTPFGAEATAKTVAQAIGPLDTTTYTLAPDKPVDREGDLTKFIVDGDFAPHLGLGPEKVIPATARAASDTSASDLFGDAAIPFVLVGTSYSANLQWSFAEALKASLGADVLNVAEEGLGPVEPMTKFLASDTLKNSPPKTVIWEFPVRYLATPKLWAPPADSDTGRLR